MYTFGCLHVDPKTFYHSGKRFIHYSCWPFFSPLRVIQEITLRRIDVHSHSLKSTGTLCVYPVCELCSTVVEGDYQILLLLVNKLFQK